MGKKLKRCPKQCKKHSFLLKPVHYSALFSRELSASFCPPSLRAPSITPKFNKDKRHFTISFVLPSEYVPIGLNQKKILRNQEYYRKEHQKWREENGIEKSNIYIAKPRTKGCYCSVCKVDYEDYLQHIEEVSHKEAIKDNRFNLFIEELELEMRGSARQDDLRIKEGKFNPYFQASGMFFTQENTYFEEKSVVEDQCVQEDGFQYQQIHDLMHHVRHPQLLSPKNDNIMPPSFDSQKQELPSLHRPIEIAEGGRILPTIKPIIISGVRSELIHQ